MLERKDAWLSYKIRFGSQCCTCQPLLLNEGTYELIASFNKEEQKRQRLERRKRARRKRAPNAGKKFHKLLDRLDKAMERHKPVDCISGKWIVPEKPKGPIGFTPGPALK